MSTQLLCMDQLNADPSQARHHKDHSPLLHPSNPVSLLQQPTALPSFTTAIIEKQKGEVLNGRSLIFAQQHQKHSNGLLPTAPFKHFLQ